MYGRQLSINQQQNFTITNVKKFWNKKLQRSFLLLLLLLLVTHCSFELPKTSAAAHAPASSNLFKVSLITPSQKVHFRNILPHNLFLPNFGRFFVWPQMVGLKGWSFVICHSSSAECVVFISSFLSRIELDFSYRCFTNGFTLLKILIFDRCISRNVNFLTFDNFLNFLTMKMSFLEIHQDLHKVSWWKFKFPQEELTLEWNFSGFRY